MGFNFGFLSFFDACNSVSSLRSPFLSLGAQEIHESSETMDAFCSSVQYPRFEASRTLSSLLAERYQVDEYADLDLNDTASLKVDLAQPIESALKGKWKTIYDGGTIEHVFDIAAAFKGAHDLCCEGGIILHISPLTWLSHGYYNLTPHLFKSVASANKYRILAVGYYFRRLLSPRGLGFWNPRKLSLKEGFVLTELDGERTSRFDEIEQYCSMEKLQNCALFCIGYQKQENLAFVVPYDIQA